MLDPENGRCVFRGSSTEVVSLFSSAINVLNIYTVNKNFIIKADSYAASLGSSLNQSGVFKEFFNE